MIMYFWVTKYNAIDTYAFGLKRELIDGGDKPQHEGKKETETYHNNTKPQHEGKKETETYLNNTIESLDLIWFLKNFKPIKMYFYVIN